ncbi:MAG: hypothetical protein JSS34_04745 [Proteobacteria bacterium]|nr:hypothetical protein [Pseudomonadota bacterium]
MFKNLFHFYTLSCCFVASTIILISSFFFISAIVDFVIPQYTFYSEAAHYETNESYLFYKKDSNRYEDENKTKNEFEKLSPSELTEKRLQERAQFFITKKNKAIETMIHSLEWILVSACFFYMNWRLYKRSLFRTEV